MSVPILLDPVSSTNPKVRTARRDTLTGDAKRRSVFPYQEGIAVDVIEKSLQYKGGALASEGA